MVLIDIQKDQSGELRTMLEAEESVGILQLEPIVRARVVRIKGVPVEELDLPEDVRWTINSDRGLSYTADPDPNINLVAGEWWEADYGDTNPDKVLLSIEDDVALGYGVWIGDTIGFNLAGRVIETEIANVREEIDWGEGRLNFIFITSPGIIEQAPQTLAASLDLPSEMEPVLLDKLAEEFPNVTPISIREIVAQLNGVVEKLGYAVRGVAAVTLFAGVLVVAAAVQISYRNRLRDLGIMRSIGATRSQARRMVMAEHCLMAGLACLPALVIGWTGAWIIVRWVLDIEWVLAPWGVVLVLAVAFAISLISGFIMVTRLLGQNTASILRQA
jgi:putative ABC transport system permease protein